MRLLLVTAAVISLASVACKQGEPTPAPGSKADQPVPKQPESKVTADGPKKPVVMISKEQRRAYRQHLKAGRDLAKQKKWVDAAARFEKALVAIPMDARALSEVGWAAFKAGDLDRALEANKASVNAATESRVKAASLYNLGRVAEGRGDKVAARLYYLRSLQLRVNETVAVQLVAVGGTKEEPWKIFDHFSSCDAKADPGEVCKCLVAEYAEEVKEQDEPEPATCSTDGSAEHGYLTLAYKAGMERYELVAAKNSKGWGVRAAALHEYNPGAFGIHEEATLELEDKKVGDKEVLWFVEKKARGDTDMGINEEESVYSEMLTICIQGTDGLRCVYQGPLSESYSRDILHSEEEDDDDVEHTKGLPIERKGRLKAELSADGTLSVRLQSGQATSWLAPYIGTHKLW